MKLLFATTNQGKLNEVRQLLSGLDLEILSLADFEVLQNVVVEETGETFQQNALIKARTYGETTDVLTLAEDSGLLVKFLDNRPGVYSARFGPTSDDRNQKLLELLQDKTDRLAEFKSVFCFYDPQTKKAEYFAGRVQGQIAKRPTGENGFGYDPVFVPQGYEQTFAELGIETKNKISHRAQALDLFHSALERRFQSQSYRVVKANHT